MENLIFAIILSSVFTFLTTPFLIKFLRSRNIGQNIRYFGPKSHFSKKDTPNLGGIVIMLAFILIYPFVVKFSLFHLIFILVIFGNGIIGFVDDYLNIKKRESLGIKARYKLLFQTILSSIFIFYFFYYTEESSCVYIPFLKKTLNLGYLYILFGILIIVGTTNAVNLTDGLDGLACGCIIIAMISYINFSLVLNNTDVALFGAIITGAVLGFLWYNIYPAKIFLGNTGSFFLGSSLAIMAILTKQEFLLIIIGGIFLIEAISVIIQVIYFRATGGKRIFKMTPIHHHFEEIGWSETQISIRFWILGIILALIGLKL